MNANQLVQILGHKLDPLVKRLTAIEEQLGQTATKKDLENFATKKDLENFATKKDLARMEKRLMRRFDAMDKTLDKDLAITMQRVKRLENLHPELPPFKPVTLNL